MAEYKIMSDSSCDLFTDILSKHDIELVPFFISFDGVNYLKDGVEITPKEVCERLREKGVFAKTSLPGIQDYADRFRVHLANGRDIICMCLSSKLSGSYQSAVNAAAMMKDEFPDRLVKVIDSYSVTLLTGMMLDDIGIMRSEGKTIFEAAQTIEKYKNDAKVYLTVDSLEYLEHGGRVGKAAALAGSILGIKPIISFEDGELHAHSKVRGRKKALHEIVEITDKFMRDNKDEYRLICLNSGCEEEGIEIMDILKGRGYEFYYPIQDIGVTISAHTGPGTVGLGYMRKRPE